MTSVNVNDMELTRERVLEALGAVQEPLTGQGLVEQRLVPEVAVEGHDVRLTIEVISPTAATKERLAHEVV